jgi:hypothetical protein
MVSVAVARDRARKRVERDLRQWAAFGGQGAEFTVPLNPPVERAALADLQTAIAWTREWRDVPGAEWVIRQWPSAGAQRVPVRLVLHGAEAIAAFAGRPEARDWHTLSERATRIRAAFAGIIAGTTTDAITDPGALSGDSTGTGALARAIRTHGRTLLALADADFIRLIDVVRWFAAHPESGWRIRQLPIRGIDTKWLAHHRAVVTGLHLAVTGSISLGLTSNPSLVRLRILDPELRPAGLCDISAPADELSQLDIDPERVFVFENLETVLAMPPLPGAVVIHGGGFNADGRIRQFPRAVGNPIIYRGALACPDPSIASRKSHLTEFLHP